jgi:hypothetical protein
MGAVRLLVQTLPKRKLLNNKHTQRNNKLVSRRGKLGAAHYQLCSMKASCYGARAVAALLFALFPICLLLIVKLS